MNQDVMKIPIIFVLISAVLTSHAVAADTLNCQCIMSTGGCNFALFDEAAGKPRKSWSQEFNSPPSSSVTPSFLALACWRKRGENPGGEGLCCDMDHDERDAVRYFKGELD